MRLRPEEIQVGDVFAEYPRQHWEIVEITSHYVALKSVLGVVATASIPLTQAAKYEYIKHLDVLPYHDRN